MALTAVEIRKVYALGARLGLVESNNKNDALHALVEGITGKGSVSKLNADEYKDVMTELYTRLRLSQLEPPPERRSKKRYESNPGKITEGQQRKVWALMYQLAGCDTEPSTASLGERLSGIIKRQFGVDATERQPMCWLSYKQGNQLIEIIKNYVKSAERKAMRCSG